MDRILMERIHINEQTERLVDSLMLIYRKKRRLFCGLCTEELDKSDVYMRLNLQFFAEGEGGEKTEDATAKKLDQAREEGQVAKSQELVIGVTLLMLFISLKVFVGYVGDKFLETYAKNYNYIGNYTKNGFNSNIAYSIVGGVLIDVVLIAAPFFIVAILCGIGVNAGQITWKVTTKPLMPKLEKIDPIKGFKRMFSKDKLIELLKSVLKIGIIFYVVYSELKDSLELLLTLYDYTLLESIAIVGDVVISLGLKISALLLVIGIADLFYQKFKFKNEMKMTKQEIKDEYKQTEGDPQIKGKIRRKMQETSMRRMMQDIPQADVVITNPTHFAVAIKYDREVSAAPLVTAKGADNLAQRIKEIARENNVEIVENKPLARMLYYNVEIGQEIPPELYQMVADILAHVYKVQNRTVQ